MFVSFRALCYIIHTLTCFHLANVFRPVAARALLRRSEQTVIARRQIWAVRGKFHISAVTKLSAMWFNFSPTLACCLWLVVCVSSIFYLPAVVGCWIRQNAWWLPNVPPVLKWSVLYCLTEYIYVVCMTTTTNNHYFFEVCHPRCVGSITKNFCVLHIQSNTT